MAVGLLVRNAFAAADLSLLAGTAEGGMPLSNLLDAQPRLRARILANAGQIALLADAGAAMTVGAILLGSTTLLAGDTLRLRGSTADATGAAGDALDVSLTASTDDDAQGQVVRPVAPSAAFRYLRIDIGLASGAARDLGLLVAGPLLRLEVGLQGLEEGKLPLGQSAENPVTGTRHDVSAPLGDARYVAGRLQFLTVAEALALRDSIFATPAVLLVPNDQDSQAELNRRSVWGALTQPRQRLGFAHSAALRRSLPVLVQERL